MLKPTTASSKNMLTKRQSVIIALLTLTQFSVVLDFMVISPLGEVLMRALVITPKQFGFAVSSYAFSAAISGLLTAGFADRFDRKKLLLFFYSGFIAGTLGCALAPSYGYLVLARIVTGLFGGVIGSISLTIVTDLIPFEKRGHAMGYLQMGFAGSQVLGVPIGLYLADLFGWHAPFALIVLFGICIAGAVAYVFEPVTAHLALQGTTNLYERYGKIFSNGDHQKAFLLTAAVYIGGFLMQPFSSAFFVNNLGITQSRLPIIFFCSGIASLLIMPVMGKLSDQVSKAKLFTIGSCWSFVFTYIYTHLSPLPLYQLINVNILLFMGVLSRNVPVTAMISAVPDGKDRGAFMSINSCIQQLAGGLAAALAGLIVKQRYNASPIEHFTWLGYSSMGIMVISVMMMWRVSKVIESKK